MSYLFERILIKVLEGVGRAMARRKDNKKGPSDLVIGRTEHPYYKNQTEDFCLSHEEALHHWWTAGSTGMGKSTLLYNLMTQLISNEVGFWLLDPHGDLYEASLNRFSEIITADDSDGKAQSIRTALVIIELSNALHTIGFNPLEAHGVDPYMQASEFMAILKERYKDDSLGARSHETLFSTLVTLSLRGLTLLEAMPLLTDSSFREGSVAQLPEGEVKKYWYRFGRLSPAMQASYSEPILHRLSIFLANPLIRQMVAQQKSTIDFSAIINSRPPKYVLTNLSKGKLKENSDLLGGFFLAKLQSAALSRAEIPESERVPFFVIMDEFQNFVGGSMDTWLSECRKYKIFLICSNQSVGQLTPELKSAVLGNCGLLVFFRMSHQDAVALSAELSPQEKALLAKRLPGLAVGEAYCRVTNHQPRLIKTFPMSRPKASAEAVEFVKNLSFATYARPRKAVEEEISHRTRTILGHARTEATVQEVADPYAGRFAPTGNFIEVEEEAAQRPRRGKKGNTNRRNTNHQARRHYEEG